MRPLGKQQLILNQPTSFSGHKKTDKSHNALIDMRAHQQKPRELTINFSSSPVEFIKQLDKLAESYEYVESLTLNFDNYYEVNDEIILQICKVLSEDFKLLKQITINESNRSRVTVTGYRELATVFKRLDSLEVVNLNLNPGGYHPQDTLSIILPGLKGARNLKKLNIEVAFRNHQLGDAGDQVIRSLSKNIQRHTRLTELSLTINDCEQISPESITSLAKSLTHLKKLNTLKLDFPKAGALPNNLSEITMTLKPLEFFSNLCLNFPSAQYFSQQDEVCRETLEGIASLTKLGALHLELGRRLSDKTLREIATTIHQLEHLTRISLRLAVSTFYSQLRDKECQGIFQSIANLKGLTEFNLCLNQCAITEELTTALFETIQTQHQQLKSLNLQLSEVSTLTDTHLLKFAQVLENLPNLSKLSVVMLYCSKVSEQGIAALTNSIGSLQSLTKLVLQASGNDVTDNVLEPLGTSLGKLSRLTNLRVIFTSSYGIAIQGINHLATNLSKLTSLVGLTMKLTHSNPDVAKIFKQKPTLIDAAIKQLPQLEYSEVYVRD
jgi:hypothetical protein